MKKSIHNILTSFLFLLILLFSLSLFAQAENTLIYGKVVDEYGNPLSNANILTGEKNQGTISNREGVFSLVLLKIPTTITISYMGFKERTIIINKEVLEKHGNYFTIVLSTDKILIDQFEITAYADKIVYRSVPSNILLDYTVNESGIILLLQEKQNKILRICNRNDTSYIDNELDFKAVTIDEDCKGNINIMTEDSVFQLFVQKTKGHTSVYIYPPHCITEYNELLSNCVGFINKNYIFKTLNKHNQKVNYWSINDSDKRNIYLVYDENRYLFAQNSLDRKNELLAKYGNVDIMGDISVNNIKIARQIMQHQWFFERIGCIPSYNPLFINNDTIIIFNHVTDSIVFLDENYNFLKSVSIRYPMLSNWADMIYQDKANGRFYAKFINNGIITLKEIDINKGDIIREIHLENKLFPEKIKIYDNHIYYIYSLYHNCIKYLMDRKI